MIGNNSSRLNYNGVAWNRFTNGTPREIWFTEGQDFQTVRPKNSPYDVNIYKAIEYAIQAGIIDTGSQAKGTYANDEAAILGGLVEGDIYELSEANTLDSAFYGLLKVVRQNAVILPQVVGTGDSNTVIGTGVPGQIIGI